MDYIDNDDYWARQWQLEAESDAYFIEQQRIELQYAAGVDMPNLGNIHACFDFVDCIFESTEVPF